MTQIEIYLKFTFLHDIVSDITIHQLINILIFCLKFKELGD